MEKKEIFDLVVQHAREILPELESHDFQMDDALKDLGANSLDRSEISIMTLESLGLSLPLTELAGAQNIRGLVELLHDKLPR